MKQTKRYISLFLIIISLLFVGFYRDFVFKNINALLQAWDADMDYQMPTSLQFLTKYEYHTLENIKWGLTLLFAIIYLAIALITIKFLFNNKKFSRLTIYTYIAITVVSALIMAIGHLFPSITDKMYSLARYLMGMAQSPIIVMILIPAFKLSEKEG